MNNPQNYRLWLRNIKTASSSPWLRSHHESFNLRRLTLYNELSVNTSHTERADLLHLKRIEHGMHRSFHVSSVAKQEQMSSGNTNGDSSSFSQSSPPSSSSSTTESILQIYKDKKTPRFSKIGPPLGIFQFTLAVSASAAFYIAEVDYLTWMIATVPMLTVSGLVYHTVTELNRRRVLSIEMLKDKRSFLIQAPGAIGALLPRKIVVDFNKIAVSHSMLREYVDYMQQQAKVSSPKKDLFNSVSNNTDTPKQFPHRELKFIIIGPHGKPDSVLLDLQDKPSLNASELLNSTVDFDMYTRKPQKK